MKKEIYVDYDSTELEIIGDTIQITTNGHTNMYVLDKVDIHPLIKDLETVHRRMKLQNEPVVKG
jgi:hypothetical protein